MIPLDPTIQQSVATLTVAQQGHFYGEYNHRAKNYNTAMLWAVLTGWWLGGHKFYLGQPIQGILHFLFAATGIPLILTIIDCFTMQRLVDRANERIAREALAKARLISVE
jgi:TM2 domain-containing membrane protein YozV